MVFNAPPAVRYIHWFCLRGGEPKSIHKIGLNRKIAKRLRLGPGQRQSQKSMHPSPSGASTSLGSSRMCIDFLVPFRNVHWFFGEVPQCASILVEVRNMCIDFPRKVPHVHRFSAEVPNMCAAIFGEVPNMWKPIFRGNSLRVHHFWTKIAN